MFLKILPLLLSQLWLQNLIAQLIQEKHFQIVLPIMAIAGVIKVACSPSKSNNNELLFLKFF